MGNEGVLEAEKIARFAGKSDRILRDDVDVEHEREYEYKTSNIPG